MLDPQKLQAIREKCVEANPEIVAETWVKPHEDVSLFQQFNAGDGKLYRPIRLADVLLAMDRQGDPNYCVTLDGDIWSVKAWGYEHKYCTWNLRQDFLDSQSPECIDFLYSLLHA